MLAQTNLCASSLHLLVAYNLLAPSALAETAPEYTQPLQLASNSAAEVIVVGQRDAPITIEPRGLAVSLGKEQSEATNAVNVEDQ